MDRLVEGSDIQHILLKESESDYESELFLGIANSYLAQMINNGISEI